VGRPRNKAARLPREHRQTVLGMLLDGETYEAIREALRADGVPEQDLPGDRALAVYAESDEFRRAHSDWLSLGARARERSLVATALAEGGIDAAADLLTFETLDRLLVALKSDEIDASEVAKRVAAIKRASIAEAEAEFRRREATLKRQAEDAREAVGRGDPARAMAELDRILGVG